MEDRECLEELAKIVSSKCRGYRLYLAGSVLIVAKSDEDIERYLYAATYPPYVELRTLEELRKSVAVVCRGNDLRICDVKSFEIALILTQELARALEDRMPFDVEGVDLVVAYRSSEDGGLYNRYEVVVRLKRSSACSEIMPLVLSIIEKLGLTTSA